MNRVILLGLRALQFLIAVTILGLAAAALAQQVYGSTPVTTRYSTFTGGWGMLVALVGVATLFISSAPPLVSMALDALAGLLFAAGGIAIAITLRHTNNCREGEAMLENGMLNRGKVSVGKDAAYGVWRDAKDDEDVFNILHGNCKRAQADEILSFISFAVAVALVGIGYLQMRRGNGRSGGYVA